MEESKNEKILTEYDLYEKQLESIKKEIEEDCPLISGIESIEKLQKEFLNNMPFLEKIQVGR